MRPEKGLTESEKIAKFASLFFAVCFMAGTLYLLFTRTWVLYFFAVCNITVISGLIFFTIREIFKTLKFKE
jgi:hypothetical protein